MRRDLPVNSSAVGKRAGGGSPLCLMRREVGMAAVVAELHLDVNELEPEAAAAVERGAAALFLAGFGPMSSGLRARGRTGQERGGGERRPARAKARGAAHLGARDVATVANRSPISESPPPC